MQDRRGSRGRPSGAQDSENQRARRLNVTFVVHAAVERKGSRYVSDMASIRYRACVPGEELAARGHRVRVLPLLGPSNPPTTRRMIDADVVVLAKSFRRETEQLARETRLRGARVLVDVCDNHFVDPELGAHQHALIDLADEIVVSTPEMSRIVRRETGRDSLIVPDPFEGPIGQARFSPRVGEPLRLLWFGHPLNLDSLTAALPSLIEFAAGQPCELRVVTTPLEDLGERLRRLDDARGNSLAIELVPWSIETTWSELARCDVVIIPSRAADEKKIVKSPNRLVETLRAGRIAIAHPIPSYREFAPYAWLGDDLRAGLNWALEAPHVALARIRAGQRFIEQGFSPERAADGWEGAFRAAMAAPGSPVLRRATDRRAAEVRAHAAAGGSRKTVTREPQAAAGARDGAGGTEPEDDGSRDNARDVGETSAPVRLNLGCGDNYLTGYVNVDVVEGRLGGAPDVVCDVRNLDPFPDEHADEVLAVHVVEHIWRWEITGVLEEWRRVLKPGGLLVVECPNLEEACREFLRDPRGRSGPGSEGQRTMWVFYGDPRWKDPLMCHRWGYTPASLRTLLEEAGFENVRQEPAEFKMREPRDMRVVGEKPRV